MAIDKKLLVTSLQHTHNWTMGNDRFKMAFWFEMLFDEDLHNDNIHELPPDDLNVVNVYNEVRNWLRRHSQKDKAAQALLDRYTADVPTGRTPGPLPKDDEEGQNTPTDESTSPVWKPDLTDKYEQDRLYARVSHEVDIWWKKVRDANYDGWVVPMETIEDAVERAVLSKDNAMHRYMPGGGDPDRQLEYDQEYEEHPEDDVHDEIDDRSTREDNGEEDEEEEDDDDSYVEGPLRGLLTEIPNILDTKQIEALHMTVKACIVDSMGSGLTPAGENLQKTRCKMFLALDCGKNLLRELLVFIAVWEQTDQQFIFQITAQIIESFHHNALLPYAWNTLRILKDIVSPAQTVLLRLINYMFRARKDSPIYDDLRDYNRDAKLIHFLYNYFRCRVVPDCIALIHAQEQIRLNKNHPSDFPVDLWDMERAKDGLSQYLDFISVIAEIPEMRHLLVEWEAVYEMITLLQALEAGVARKTLDERPMPGPSRPPSAQTQGSQEIVVPPAPAPVLPPLHDTPHKFPWAGIKIQILIILTSLVAPTNARRQGPGNPTVQKQLLGHQGIMPLLNCCVYDGNNEYLKERATLCIKFVMEGCEEAQKFVRELVPVKQAQAQAQAAQQAQLSANTVAQAHAQAQALAQAQKEWNPTPPTTSQVSMGPILPPLPPSFKANTVAPASQPSSSNSTAPSASSSSSTAQSKAMPPVLPPLPTSLPTRKVQSVASPAGSARAKKENERLKLENAALEAKKRENLALIKEKERELSEMVGSSRGRTIELTDTASKIAAANRQVEEMRKFYERTGKDFDGKGGK
jgi:palmitoyltransferase